MPLEVGLMARLIFNGAHREVLWTLTSGGRPRTLPADNLDDPAVHLLAMGLVEVVDGRLRATQAGYDLRKLIARTAMNDLCDTYDGPETARWTRRTPER